MPAMRRVRTEARGDRASRSSWRIGRQGWSAASLASGALAKEARCACGRIGFEHAWRPRAREQRGCEEQRGAWCGEPGEKFSRDETGLGLKFNFFLTVDGREGMLDGIGVGGAEKFSTSRRGHVDKRVLVDVGGNLGLADFVAGFIEFRHRRPAFGAGANGINGNAARAGDGGGLFWLECAGIIAAIGQQDDKRAFAAALFDARGLIEARQGKAETVANGGGVGIDDADANAFDLP